MAAMKFKRVLPDYFTPQNIRAGILPNNPLYVPEITNNPLDDPNAWSDRLYEYYGKGTQAQKQAQTQAQKQALALAKKNQSSQGSTTKYTGTVNSALQKALQLTGSPSSWMPYMQWLVSKESSGNPRAVNSTPVGREHATGLLQTLPSTFKSYALPGYGNIYNPVDNAAAAIRYIKSRYGSPANIPGIYGSSWRGY